VYSSIALRLIIAIAQSNNYVHIFMLL